MKPERWLEVRRFLARVLELPEGEREAFVRRESAGDEELASAVLQMLRVDSEAMPNVLYEERAVELLALQEALERLAEFDAAMLRAVELHFFGGVSLEETARVLEIPMRRFRRRWKAARTWLRAEIG